MQSRRRDGVVVSSEPPARTHHPFRHPQPLPHPHRPIHGSRPHLPSHHLDAKPLLRPGVPAPQPSQPLPRAPDVPHPDAIAGPLHDAEVPRTPAPNHLRGPAPSLGPVRGVDGEDTGVPAPSEPIVQPHPLRKCPRGQHPLEIHAQRGHYPLHALAVAGGPAPPARSGVHPRHGPLPVSVRVEDAHAALASGEEGVDVLGAEEEGMRRRPGFRGRADERVRG